MSFEGHKELPLPVGALPDARLKWSLFRPARLRFISPLFICSMVAMLSAPWSEIMLPPRLSSIRVLLLCRARAMACAPVSST